MARGCNVNGGRIVYGRSKQNLGEKMPKKSESVVVGMDCSHPSLQPRADDQKQHLRSFVRHQRDGGNRLSGTALDVLNVLDEYGRRIKAAFKKKKKKR